MSPVEERVLARQARGRVFLEGITPNELVSHCLNTKPSACYPPSTSASKTEADHRVKGLRGSWGSVRALFLSTTGLEVERGLLAASRAV